MTLELSDGKPVKLFPVWKELVRVADTWEYGTFHTHEEIAGILGVEAQTSLYYGHVQKARESLIERRKLLETYVNQGYLVVEVDRYNDVTLNDLKKSKRFLELSLLKSSYAPVELMDEQTKKRHDQFLVKQVGLLNMTAPVYTEITKIVAPIPRRFQLNKAKPSMEVDSNEND